MMENKKEHIGDWLEKLQRESWNLELLVSGFSIFLLAQAFQGMESGLKYINLHTSIGGNLEGVLRSFILIMLLAIIILIFNLVVHVFLRGFWIGAVGLRSVQEKINLEELGYSDFFTQKLKKRVPTLDKMLEQLDTLSSVVFSFTFLVVFMLISFFLFISTLSIFSYFLGEILLENIGEETFYGKIIFIIGKLSIAIALLSGIIYFIDTLSLGFFKKYKWLSKIYFPVYKFIGWITLASVYRSIYYSLISRFPKNKIRLALAVYLILFFMIPFMKFDQYIYFPDNNFKYSISSNFYDDQREEGNAIYQASIPSQIIKSDFIPLFIRYRIQYNKVLQKICTEFIPEKKDGLNSGIKIDGGNVHLNEPNIKEDNPEKALACWEDFFSIKIDSIQVTPKFYFHEHPNESEKGIFAMLEIANFSKGKHDIYIDKKTINEEEEIEEEKYSHIVFWKE